MTRILSRLGAHLGNWNDRTNGNVTMARLAQGLPVNPHHATDLKRRPGAWRAIDRAASWMFTLPDRTRS